MFVLIGDEGVHVAVDILDESLELLRAYGGHIQKHQDIPFFLRMLYFV